MQPYVIGEGEETMPLFPYSPIPLCAACQGRGAALRELKQG
jgi:hypothetical protein